MVEVLPDPRGNPAPHVRPDPNQPVGHAPEGTRGQSLSAVTNVANASSSASASSTQRPSRRISSWDVTASARQPCAFEPLGDVGAVRVVVHQLLHVELPLDAELVGDLLEPLLHLRAPLVGVDTDRLGGDPAAGGAELGDRVRRAGPGRRRADTSADPRPATRWAGRHRSRSRATPSASRAAGPPATCVQRRRPASRRCSASVAALYSSTLGWSISKTVVPAGHSMRYARESRPEARITIWRMPAAAAVGEVRVEEVRAHRLVVAHVPEDRGDLGVDGGGLLDDILVEHRRPRPGARTLDEDLGVGIADQRVVACRSRRHARPRP